MGLACLACLASRTGIWQLPNRGVPWSTRVATQRSYRSQLCATRRWRCSTSRQHMLKPFAASWKKSCRGLRPKTIKTPILVNLTLQCCRLVEKGLTVVWNMSGFKITWYCCQFWLKLIYLGFSFPTLYHPDPFCRVMGRRSLWGFASITPSALILLWLTPLGCGWV